MEPRRITVQLPAGLPDGKLAEIAYAIHGLLIAADVGGGSSIHTDAARAACTSDGRRNAPARP